VVEGTADGEADDVKVNYDKMEDLIDGVLGKCSDNDIEDEDGNGNNEGKDNCRYNSEEDIDANDNFFPVFEEGAV